MKFISWNVNGLRACVQKRIFGLFSGGGCGYFLHSGDASCRKDRSNWSLPGYHQYWNYAKKKGYSGTAIFTKQEPMQCTLRNWRWKSTTRKAV